MAVSAFLLLLAEAPGADAAAPTEWLVGTATGPRAAAAATPGTQIAPGIRVMRAHRAEARRLRRHPGVRWVEPNRRFSPSSLAAPTDAFFRQQWALRDARVPKAWRTSVGGNVIVAVLDTGVDATHPDLAGNLWTNPGELPGNGVDDDGNGFVDDLHGADMVNGDGDPADGAGHGTAVAGVIGARGNDGTGISGVAWHIRLMPVKVLPDHGFGTTATLVAGLRYALANGARVVNMSLNGSDPSLALDEAIAAAEAQQHHQHRSEWPLPHPLGHVAGRGLRVGRGRAPGSREADRQRRPAAQGAAQLHSPRRSSRRPRCRRAAQRGGRDEAPRTARPAAQKTRASLPAP